MIQVENLTKRYGQVTAVDDISFSIETGDICAFLGPNGAGKTSTMRVLTGFMPATIGKVEVAGFDIFKNPMEVKKRVGYLPESTPLYTDMRVSEYLELVAEVKGVSSRMEKRKKIADVMDSCGITDRQRYLIGSLSKGYRQRVGLAQALINDPEVLILDEPSIGLDPEQIVEIRSLIKDLAGKRTVILSTHILPEAQMICSRVLIINKGKLIADDTPENLANRVRDNAITIGISGASSEIIAETLRSVEGVLDVAIIEGNEKASKFRVTPKGGVNPRKAITKAVVEKEWELTEFSSESLSLEDVYMKLVSGDGEGER